MNIFSMFFLAIVGIILAFVMLYFIREYKFSAIRKEAIKKEQEQRRILIPKILEVYTKELESAPKNKKYVNIRQQVPTLELQRGSYILWTDKVKLYFLINIPPTDSSINSTTNIGDYTTKTLLISQIEYYSTKGEVYHENRISGGGGGSSLTGAVVGGLIAGGVGAIIGSRKKTQSITSGLITHDTRNTFINFYIDKNRNERKSIFLDIEDYQTLTNLLPEKDYSIVSALRTHNLLQQTPSTYNTTKAITDQIKELANLKDNGIISNEEFLQKKKELLARI